jgi:hypothetical protein
MVQSRVSHQSVELNHGQKIDSDRDLALSKMQEFLVPQFDAALASQEVAFEPGEKPGKLHDQGIAIVALHHKAIAPAVRPLPLEEHFTADLGHDFPFDRTGVWDLVERDGTIADTNVYRKTPQQEELDKDLQFTIYALAYRTTRGEMEPGLRMDAIVKTGNPRPVQLPTRRTNGDCRWLLGLMETVGRAIASGIFYPNPSQRYRINYAYGTPKWKFPLTFENYTFMQGRVADRTRRNPKLSLVSDPHTYEEPGRYRIFIKVTHIFGNDTSQVYDGEVK